MDKLFSVAGVSVLDGTMKVRFANDMNRVKVLEKNGHTKVRLIELPESMTKTEAASFLLTNEQFQDKAIQNTLKAYLSAFEGEQPEEEQEPAKPAAKEPKTRVREPRPSDKYETPVRPAGAAKAIADAKAKAQAATKGTRGRRRKVAVAGNVSEAQPAEPVVAINSESSAHNATVLKKAYKTWQEQRDTVGEEMLKEANAKIDSWG